MAKVHGVAGEWARVRGVVWGLWPLFLGVFVSGAAVALLWTSVLLGWSLLVASLVYVIFALSVGLHRVERFYKGARGEEKVAGVLANLPAAYHVFNDFAIGRDRVDHVVVGPTGVFAVETKFWNGQVTVEDGYVLLNGRLPSHSPLAQVDREAAQVRKALATSGWKGPVVPVLAFASDSFVPRSAEVKGAIVANSNELLSIFVAGRTVLPSAELERLVSLMENCP